MTYGEECLEEFLFQCRKFRRARTEASRHMALERAYDQIDLYLTWQQMTLEESNDSQA